MRTLILLLLLAAPLAAEEKPITDAERQFVLDEIKEGLDGREPVVEKQKLNELAWSRRIHLTMQPSKREYRLWDGTRVDVLTPRHAIEVEWATKWAESFAQSVYYAETADKVPAVILLVKDFKTEERYVYRAKVVAAKLNILLWLVDTRKNELRMAGSVIQLKTPEGVKREPGLRVRGAVLHGAASRTSTTIRGQWAVSAGLVQQPADRNTQLLSDRRRGLADGEGRANGLTDMVGVRAGRSVRDRDQHVVVPQAR
jgi:hypothetical protein